MTFDLDSALIDVACPSCRSKARARLGRLRRDATLTCLDCGVNIPIDGPALRADALAVQQAFEQAAAHGRSHPVPAVQAQSNGDQP